MVPEIRVLALLPYPVKRVGGQRYRIEQWAPRMRREGVSVTYSPFLQPSDLDVLWASGHIPAKARAVLSGYGRRLKDLGTVDRFDVAFVYREAGFLGTTWLEQLVARRCPIVYDFDDAIYLPATSGANRSFSFLKKPSKVDALCRLATAVTVGNEHLAGFARRHSSHVHVVPTTIETDEYRLQARAANSRPVVAWTGSQTTVPYLERLGPALRRLRQLCDFELLVIGARTSIEGIDVRLLPWRAETEVLDLAPADVGLMPLTDDEWSRGKCGLKALQYMALGIPPVVSPVGVNTRIVTHGVNGLHAASDDEWVEHVRQLLSDAELRRRLGKAARSAVDAHYSACVHAPRMAALFKDVVQLSRRLKPEA
ncbi:MAG: glycosyltransferase family 4 protein [Vicinamibacterales bacterium]